MPLHETISPPRCAAPCAAPQPCCRRGGGCSAQHTARSVRGARGWRYGGGTDGGPMQLTASDAAEKDAKLEDTMQCGICQDILYK